MSRCTVAGSCRFLSTLSLRRATDDVCGCRRYGGNFYPRSPYGERRVLYCHLIPSNDFYPRSPYGERRCGSGYQAGPEINFYPRSPYGERRSAQFLGAESGYFYPRSPCGERQQLCPLLAIRTNFYPRSPCGERRSDGFHRGAKVAISIHALLAESDYIAAAAAGSCPAFLSTLSLRRATR